MSSGGVCWRVAALMAGLLCLHRAWPESAATTIPAPDGQFDVRALQAVVDEAAGRGGVVSLPAGRFLLADTLRLRSGVKIVGVPNRTILVLGPGRATLLAHDVRKGATEITLVDATGFDVGDGVALEDSAGHGFEVTTATLVARLGPHTFRISQPAESDYLVSRRAEVKRTFSGIGGWHVKDVVVEGVTIEGNYGQPGSEYLGGCRGGGIYLFGCDNVTMRKCAVRKYNGDAISFQGQCRGVVIEHCLCEDNFNVGMHPGSGSHHCTVRHNVLRKNGYVGLFVCVGVRHCLFEGNHIVGNAGCGISIGMDDSDNVFRNNVITDNAETGILFRCDSLLAKHGAHRNVFEKNLVKDNLGPRPAKSNSRPSSAGQACVVIEGIHQHLIFRQNLFVFSHAHPGCVVLHDAGQEAPRLEGNQLVNIDAAIKPWAPAAGR